MSMEKVNYVILSEKGYSLLIEALAERPFKEVASAILNANADIQACTERFGLVEKVPTTEENVNSEIDASDKCCETPEDEIQADTQMEIVE